MKKETNFFLVAILFLASLLLSSGCVNDINVLMDGYHHLQFSISEPEGNKTIDQIVDETAQHGKNASRLGIISEKITKDFTDSYWNSQHNEKYFCRYPPEEDPKWAWCSPFGGIFDNNPHSYWYVYDKRGHVRTTTMGYIDLTYNPKWIALQKTGACESLAILFNETANRSGFISRIVTSKNAKHTWNEVMVNGEWKYYDVQQYGQNNQSQWFGDRNKYGNNSDFSHDQLTMSGICVFDLEKHDCGDEMVTEFYYFKL
jgi:hypothetical protein